ncbi:MAG: hypothetical protein QG646_1218 [Euryarchaeota archaeon]|nr:hypothetical protein [Euryarchaeota archaeon]
MRQASLVILDGASPLRVKVSHQPVTETHTARGNECCEAGKRELSDRNASEGFEPRNPIYYDGRLFPKAGMQQLVARNGKSDSHHRGLSPQYDNIRNYQELGRSVMLATRA